MWDGRRWWKNFVAFVVAALLICRNARQRRAVTATLLLLAVLWAVVDGDHVFSRAEVRQRLEQISGVLLIGLAVRVAVDSG